jgi:hypothetical protein
MAATADSSRRQSAAAREAPARADSNLAALDKRSHLSLIPRAAPQASSVVTTRHHAVSFSSLLFGHLVELGFDLGLESVPRVKFLLPSRRAVLIVCHAMIMAITVVLPAPVASFSASRVSSGLASLLAAARWSRSRLPFRVPAF